MMLDKYNQKRNFNSTGEPKGEVENSRNELIFVVQKHAASHLHYDFRLELNGVLKSWAVPKGPSMNPNDKRLAIMVEDHPYTYKDFEGTIPKGNYGAGNVIVWDNGTFTLPEAQSKAAIENKLQTDLKKGHLHLILNGEKLKGEFSLVKLNSEQENSWLLIKKNDSYATDVDILKKDKSVLSNATLEDLEKKSAKDNFDSKKNQSEIKTNGSAEFIKPMLAHTVEKPFDKKDWIFEMKYDGYRTIAVINPDGANLFSRNHLSFNKNFKAIADELKKINHVAVLDGEIVIEDEAGQSDFQLLQNYIKTGKGKLKYYVFDILNLDGNDTSNLPLIQRKELLEILLNKSQLSNVFYSQHIQEKGILLYEHATKKNLEGIMAKDANSLYRSGKRSTEWLKIRISQQEEAIIIGVTESKTSRNYFGALLLAQYDGEELRFIGKCGTGFKEETLKDLYAQFEPYFIDKSPIKDKIPLRDKIKWLKPKFVCQVKFTEWTQDNYLRHPVFQGLRIDKKAEEINFPLNEEKTSNKKITAMAIKNENDFYLKMGKISLHLTNQNKIFFPDDDISKGDLVNYYNSVSEFILPYLKDRPQSMNRFPNGINGQSFYQKDVDVEKIPSWLKTEKIHSESNSKYIDYLLCNDEATLLYMANLGCIELNPWNSTINKIDKPDWAVIDLDPAKNDFKEVVKTALTVKEIMDELETECYCKTSGATGLHIYIPLEAQYPYDSVRLFSELIANKVVNRSPKTTSVLRTVQSRGNKIYIDFLQNRKGQTLASPYSVRPRPGATVSTPLEWGEVNEKLSPSQFTIKNVLKRFDKKGDLWKPVLGKGANLEMVLKKISENPPH
jgi:bifunctional non-homologous end joining protein LigD